jgi:hypothetical protein
LRHSGRLQLLHGWGLRLGGHRRALRLLSLLCLLSGLGLLLARRIGVLCPLRPVPVAPLTRVVGVGIPACGSLIRHQRLPFDRCGGPR